MPILFDFLVWEVYEDEAPEPHGNEVFDHVPTPGEVIELHWLEGDSAGKRVVLAVDEDRLEIHACAEELYDVLKGRSC